MANVFSFEGVNGAGKSTVINNLHYKLRENFSTRQIYSFHCPGSGIEKVREIVKDPNNQLSAKAYMFLNMADFAVLSERINDMDVNSIVLLDRFVHSTFAYQSGMMNLCGEIVKMVSALIPLKTNLTFFLDVTYENSIRRRLPEDYLDRFESIYNKDRENFNKLRGGYFNSCGMNEDRFIHINANRDVDIVTNECYSEIEKYLIKK